MIDGFPNQMELICDSVFTRYAAPAIRIYAPAVDAARARFCKQLLVLGALVTVLTTIMAAIRPGPAPAMPIAQALSARTTVTLMDWHIAGLWVINSPVAWVKVVNYNDEPIKDVAFTYQTYTIEGTPLDAGTYHLEGTIPAHATKNYFELYLGLISLDSQGLTVQVSDAQPG